MTTTASGAGASFPDELREHVGRSAPFNRARDPVNEPMIRHWCDIIDDANPVYTDPDAARASVFGGIVAPPAMLDVWDKPGLHMRRDPDNPQSAALNVLDAAGFTSTVAVNSELEFARPLRPGEWLHSTLTLENVSDEKQTALGTGHFVTSRISYLAGEELAGTVRFRVLKFRPGTGRAPAADGAAPAAAASSGGTSAGRPARRADTRPAASVTAGDELAACPIPITPTLIVGGALATLDYFDAHHDRDMAHQRGSKDIFMNIHTTLGLCQRYVSDWAGPDAVWRALRVRLGAPNYPGDTMTMTGSVTAVDEATGGVTIGFRGANALGDHVAGTAELVLPGADAPGPAT